MKQNTVKVKERYNWPVTILLIIGIVLVILLPLYMALMIAIKDPSDMNNILALPKKENQTSELCRCLGNDKFSKKVS